MALSCRSRAMTAKKCAKRELPNIVLKKNEYSRAMNASYTVQTLMSFCCHSLFLRQLLYKETKQQQQQQQQQTTRF